MCMMLSASSIVENNSDDDLLDILSSIIICIGGWFMDVDKRQSLQKSESALIGQIVFTYILPCILPSESRSKCYDHLKYDLY